MNIFLIYLTILITTIACSSDVSMNGGGVTKVGTNANDPIEPTGKDGNPPSSDDQDNAGLNIENGGTTVGGDSPSTDDPFKDDDPDDLEITSETIGYNFEDGSDNDHNDGVVCMTGKFKYNVETGVVMSLEDQAAVLELKRNSGDAMSIKIDVRRVDENNQARVINVVDRSFDNKETATNNFSFKRGDKIKVVFNENANTKAVVPFRSGTSDYEDVEFAKDVCNLTGN